MNEIKKKKMHKKGRKIDPKQKYKKKEGESFMKRNSNRDKKRMTGIIIKKIKKKRNKIKRRMDAERERKRTEKKRGRRGEVRR